MGYARRIAHIDPNFNSTISLKSITKSTEPVMLASEVSNIMRRAFTKLRNGRGGPVVVEIPRRHVRPGSAGATFELRARCWRPQLWARTPVHVRRSRRAGRRSAAENARCIYAGTRRPLGPAPGRSCKKLAELLARAGHHLARPASRPSRRPIRCRLGSGGVAMTRMVPHFLDRSRT
jgi:acetolactate synthase-1/2/3 large subunit